MGQVLEDLDEGEVPLEEIRPSPAWNLQVADAVMLR